MERDERRLQAQLAVCVEMETIGEANAATHRLEGERRGSEGQAEGQARLLFRLKVGGDWVRLFRIWAKILNVRGKFFESGWAKVLTFRVVS